MNLFWVDLGIDQTKSVDLIIHCRREGIKCISMQESIRVNISRWPIWPRGANSWTRSPGAPDWRWRFSESEMHRPGSTFKAVELRVVLLPCRKQRGNRGNQKTDFLDPGLTSPRKRLVLMGSRQGVSIHHRFWFWMVRASFCSRMSASGPKRLSTCFANRNPVRVSREAV